MKEKLVLCNYNPSRLLEERIEQVLAFPSLRTARELYQTGREILKNKGVFSCLPFRYSGKLVYNGDKATHLIYSKFPLLGDILVVGRLKNGEINSIIIENLRGAGIRRVDYEKALNSSAVYLIKKYFSVDISRLTLAKNGKKYRILEF